MAITWNAVAETPTNSDEDVLINIKMSNPCDASDFFHFNGSSECDEGHVTCIESIRVKIPSNEWEICTPSQDSLCTISINNGTSWDHNDLIIVKENGSDLFTDGDVVGDSEYQDWEIIWVDQVLNGSLGQTLAEFCSGKSRLQYICALNQKWQIDV